MLRASSTTAKALAAAIIAASAITSASTAGAQQVTPRATTPGPDFSTCDRSFRNDDPRLAGCYATVRIQFDQARIRDGERRIEAANAEGQCADRLKAGVQSGAIRPDAGRALLNGRTLQQYGACNLLRDLTRS